ncbi:MAG: hypothetical protein A2452_10195 [Candidatus Firestonebacteria bacterium RIFOXYC2_FULL_39_67]|nr:MAG: hypothetical protein A2536_06565 [Candidatus Firestonebacteria bacterium RIFOXYD2_FULL_39_29]OGF54274.1 MAG: hypothetical protein A2452_10195 [Candidatus Firestonebacteria bacterium RIFOXYC2_FULL_39_67]
MEKMLKIIIIAGLLGASIYGADKQADNPSQSQLTEKGQYTIASKLYIQNEDKKNSFYEYKRFIRYFPDSDKAPKAQFMLGECLFTEAIKAFSLKQVKDLRLKSKVDEKGVVLPEEVPFIPTFDNAIEEYKKVGGYSRNEVSDDALFRIAECYYNKGNYEKAIETFRDLTNVYSDSYLKSEAIYSIALCCLIREKWEEAANVLVQLGTMYPAYADSPKVQFALGLIAYYKNDISAAYERFKNVKTAEGYYYTGRCLDLQGKGFSAIVNYRKVVIEFPKSNYVERASYSIPESFYSATDYFSAANSYRKFMDQFPKSAYKAYASYKIGCSFFLQKNYNEAIKVFEDTRKTYADIEVAPVSAYLIAESLRKQSKLSEANVKYGSVVTEYFKENVAPYAQYKIGWCYYTVGAYPMAAGAYEQYNRDFDRHELFPYSLYMTANNFYKEKKFADSSKYYGMVLDKMPATNLYEASLCLLNDSEYEQRNFDQIITNYQFIANTLKPSDSVWRARTFLYVADAYFRSGLYKDAQMVFDMIRRDFKNTPEAVHAQSGMSYVSNATGKYDMAEKETKKVLESFDQEETKDTHDKMVTQSQYEIADSLFNQKKYTEALSLYEKYANDNSEDVLAPEALYRSGLCYYRLEYYSNAIKSWENLVEKYKNDKKAPEALYQVADTYFRAQKYTEAVTAFRKLIANYSEAKWVKDAQLRIGQSYYNAREYDSAMKEFKKYLDLYPEDAQVADVIESLESATKKKVEASAAAVTAGTKTTAAGADTENPVSESIDTLKSILVKYPNSKIAGEIQFKIGRKYYDDKKYDKAAEELLKVIMDYPETSSAGGAHFFLAESYYKLQNYEEALSAYRRYINNFSADEYVIDALFHSATSNYNLKLFADAALSYKEILKKFPESEFASAAMFNMALAYKKANKLEEAAATYTEFNKKYPADQNALSSLSEAANIYQKLKRFDLALESYRKYPFKNGDEASLEIQYQIAECFMKQDKNDEAEKELIKLGEMEPKSGAWRLTGLAKLAEIYEEKKKIDEAINIYNDIIKNAGKDEWINAAKLRIESIKAQLKEQGK